MIWLKRLNQENKYMFIYLCLYLYMSKDSDINDGKGNVYEEPWTDNWNLFCITKNVETPNWKESMWHVIILLEQDTQTAVLEAEHTCWNSPVDLVESVDPPHCSALPCGQSDVMAAPQTLGHAPCTHAEETRNRNKRSVVRTTEHLKVVGPSAAHKTSTSTKTR